MDEVRIDKFLWSIRAFKTRSEATDACNGGKIRLNGGDVKPSKLVHRGDEIVVRKPPVTYTYKAGSKVGFRFCGESHSRGGIAETARTRGDLFPQEGPWNRPPHQEGPPPDGSPLGRIGRIKDCLIFESQDFQR